MFCHGMVSGLVGGGVSGDVTMCISIVIFLEKELTFTQGEWTSSSLTMTMRLPRQR